MLAISEETFLISPCRTPQMRGLTILYLGFLKGEVSLHTMRRTQWSKSRVKSVTRSGGKNSTGQPWYLSSYLKCLKTNMRNKRRINPYSLCLQSHEKFLLFHWWKFPFCIKLRNLRGHAQFEANIVITPQCVASSACLVN